MGDYYAKKLSGERLQRVYDIAGPRVRQYLEAEINHVLKRLKPSDHVLELGCGYGRVTIRLASTAAQVVGIDNASGSLSLARRLDSRNTCTFSQMDAIDLQFEDETFDVVVCAQNGICAFAVDPVQLILEVLRVVRPGGLALFSSYADSFWPHRLAWFESQAAKGLLGAIDYAHCTNGVIACHDGFRSGRMTPEDFRGVCKKAGVREEHFSITEVDASSLFCEIAKANHC